MSQGSVQSVPCVMPECPKCPTQSVPSVPNVVSRVSHVEITRQGPLQKLAVLPIASFDPLYQISNKNCHLTFCARQKSCARHVSEFNLAVYKILEISRKFDSLLVNTWLMNCIKSD